MNKNMRLIIIEAIFMFPPYSVYIKFATAKNVSGHGLNVKSTGSKGPEDRGPLILSAGNLLSFPV
jgi:hypothetical protein